jgi:hypothetical protein
MGRAGAPWLSRSRPEHATPLSFRCGRSERKQTHLVPLSIKYIPRVERHRQEHAVRHPSKLIPLACDHGKIDDDPKDESGAHLVERFDVK